MEAISSRAAGQRALLVLAKVLVGAVIVCLLYFGKPILLPIALALFLVMILTPLVTALHRRHVPRTLSVVLVVLMVTIVLGVVAAAISVEFTSLVRELPTHTENLKGKIRSIRGLSESALVGRFDEMWTEIRAEWRVSPNGSTAPVASGPGSPVERVQSESTSSPSSDGVAWMAHLPGMLRPVVDVAVSLGMALLLAFFILLRREALRNRIICLVNGSLIVATKAVDDAGERISRYLRMQLIINSTYGAIWGLGLYFIGLDYAALWGFLAAALRFVPYIGPWIAGVLPVALALAQFPGWTQLALIVGLIVALELVSNNLMEPMLYGRSTGVSEVAMLVSAAFWTFLWGPAGLVLSGPITVCLAVVGKYFPQVSFLNLLLGNGPVLEPHVGYYQRLVARDQDEATQLVLAQTKVLPLDQVFDDILVPALNLIKRDRVRTDVTESDEEYVIETTREIVEDLVDDISAEAASRKRRDKKDAISAPEQEPEDRRVRMMGFPARDAEDQLGLELLRHLLNDREWDFEIEPAGGASTGEWVERVAERTPAIVCVASLPPGGRAHTRYVCKKLRSRFPDIRIAVGRWGLEAGIATDEEHFESVGADYTATTLRGTRDQLNSWLPVFADERIKELASRTEKPSALPEVHADPIPSTTGNGK